MGAANMAVEQPYSLAADITRQNELMGAGLSYETVAKKLIEAQVVATAEGKLAA